MSDTASKRMEYPTKFERGILAKADLWLRGILAPAAEGGAPRRRIGPTRPIRG
jgi:hypothetical protein